jgi:phospholipase/carboxylesterase
VRGRHEDEPDRQVRGVVTRGRSPSRARGARLVLAALLAAVLPAGAYGCDQRRSDARPAAEPPGSSPPARAGTRAPTEQDDGRLAGLSYVEVMTGGAAPGEAVPVVFALHGLGDRPENFAPLFRALPARARVIVPRALEPWGDGGYSWFPLQGVTDAARAEGIARAAEVVASAIAEVQRKKPTTGRPLVTGFSQGGMLSFVLAVRHPEAIAGAYPISGWLPPPLWPTERGAGDRPPLVALHGDADKRLPIGPTREGVERLRSLGIPAELRAYPGVGHTVSPEMRRDLSSLLGEAIERAAGPG